MDVIVTDRCQGCGACLLTCPEHAIEARPTHPADPLGRPPPTHPADLMDGPHGGPLRVVRGLCTGCLECIEICPADAIEARVETRVEARVKARVEAREEGR